MIGMRPPRLAAWLLDRCLPGDPDGRSIAGDLYEEFLRTGTRSGWVAARMGYRRQALDVCLHALGRSLSARLRLMPLRSHPRAKGRLMESLWQDLRYAARGMRRRPLIAALVITMVALGIGANTAVFSVVDGLLLRPLPFPDADRVVAVTLGHVERGFVPGTFSPPDRIDFTTATTTLDEVAGYSYTPGRSFMRLLGEGDPVELAVTMVSDRFFPLLGVSPAIGRGFRPEEFVEGSDGVVLLSDATWRSRYGADPGVLGRTISLGDRPATVIGVLPRAFDFPDQHVQAWVPISWMTEDMTPSRRGVRWQSLLGRLRPGATVPQAQEDADRVVRHLAEQFPGSNEGFTQARVTPIRQALLGDTRAAILVLQGATLLVLLLASANIANLLLAQATSRGHELAVRLSLGAAGRRLGRQFMTESLVLASVGGIVGIGLAAVMVRGLVVLGGEAIPRSAVIAVDGRVAVLGLALAVAAGLVFGMFPAHRAARVHPAEMLKEGAGDERGGRRPALRSVLMVAEVALAVMLVSGAALMVKSFRSLLGVDPGFDASGVLAVDLRVAGDEMESLESLPVRQREFRRAIAAIPGVVAVGGAKTAVLSGGGEPYAFAYLDDQGEARRIQPESGAYIVTPGYFEALGIPLLRGRPLNERDSLAIVITASLAERLWPGEDAVGKALYLSREARFEVVGVVANVHNEGIATPPRTAAYVPGSLFPRTALSLYVRTEGDPIALTDPVRRAIWSVNPQQPIGDIHTVQDAIKADLAGPQFLTALLGMFGGLAIVIAALGIYGVVSYGVARRSTEMGIRMALGARGRDVVGLVVGQSMAICLVGTILGLAAAAGLNRFLGSLLFGVSPSDVSAYGLVVGGVVAVSMVASLVPALRASRVDPVRSLRAE